MLISACFYSLYSHLYWTELAVASDDVTLSELNLRDNTIAILTSSSNPQISPVLALDSVTDRLWVSEQSTGDILSCDVSAGTMDCRVEVNTSLLLNSIPRSRRACFLESVCVVNC